MRSTPTSPAPELIRAHDLLKAGERNAAGKLIKSYLASHPRDADAWWLMSYAVTRPDNVQKCLHNVLKARPDHAPALARLAQVTGVPEDEPDDMFFLGEDAVSAAAAPPTPVPSPAPPVASSSAPPFDAPIPFAADEPADAAPPPFVVPVADAPTPATPSPFVTSAEVPAFEPDADLGKFDPFAFIDTEARDNPFSFETPVTQAPGTGGQPNWGPGLGFVHDADDSARPHPGAPAAPAQTRRAETETLVGVSLIVIAVLILIGVLLYVANDRGIVHLWGLPPMQTVEAATFTLEIPEEWGGACGIDAGGYPVCSVANDRRFVDLSDAAVEDAGYDEMLSGAMSDLLDFDSYPDVIVTATVMDVPQGSTEYPQASQAKVLYDGITSAGPIDDLAVDYDQRELTLDGHAAQYYQISLGNSAGGLAALVGGGDDGEFALYDLYLPHGDRMLWMMVGAFSLDGGADIPDDLIDHMVESIELK